MEYRPLGATDLTVSTLGFGCGNVGALMIRGSHDDHVRAVECAAEAGINYFDTAAQYGDGESERNLGHVLRETGVQVHVGTKVRVDPADFDHIEEAILRSVDASLSRLDREYVDLIQLHNSIASQRTRGALTPEDVLDHVVPAFQRLQQGGKVRAYGMTGMGETECILQVVDTGMLHTVQVAYNLLNPTAGYEADKESSYQDFGRLLEHAGDQRMGTLAIRVLAGGALTGSAERHPIASPAPNPMGTGASYADDVMAAGQFEFLIRDGYVHDLVEAAIRFAASNRLLSVVLVGYSSVAQLEHAIAAIERGPLPPQALERLVALREGRFLG